MGIFCEINLNKLPNGVYRPGSTVSGAIKYAVDENTMLNKITVSLKGKGKLRIRRNHGQHSTHFYRSEEYVDLNEVITKEENEIVVTKGSHEVIFSLLLPHNTPPTLRYQKHKFHYVLWCKIRYYVHIKFHVGNAKITPLLSLEPRIFGERKVLFRIYKKEKSEINLKATLENYEVRPGGIINIKYELLNNTNVTITKVNVKLMRILKFFIGGYSSKVEIRKPVPGTETKTGSVSAGDTQIMEYAVVVPSDEEATLGNSNLVSRDFVMRIVVRLPMPHRDMVLEIPVQISDVIDEFEEISRDDNDPPPSYWEVMGEDDGDKSSAELH